MLRTTLLGIPTKLGTSKGGAEFGPKYIRQNLQLKKIKISGLSVFNGGDIRVDNKPDSPFIANAKNIKKIIALSKITSKRVKSILDAGNFPLILGGDHSACIGTILGDELKFGTDLGVVYLDAHADFNTPDTTPSGNVHGMSLALVCGLVDKATRFKSYLDPKNIIITGVRSIDPGEQVLLGINGLNVVRAGELNTNGLGSFEKNLDSLSSRVKNIHLSLDIDVLDPVYAPATATPEPNGLKPDDIKNIIGMLISTGKLRSFEIMEVNKRFDKGRKTAKLVADIVTFFLKNMSNVKF